MNQQSANTKCMAMPFAAALFLALAGCSSGPAPDDRLNATLWMQQAVEYKAATDGVYALASIRLAEALADPAWTAVPDVQSGDFSDLPQAIILDADETVLDNSAYQAGLIKTGGAYSPESWNAYANSGSAGAVPGAVAFTQAAATSGVTVFYITNRDVITEEATTNNLTALGFPMGGNIDTVMTKNEQPDWTSRKGTRRAAVAKDYRVLLLLGDNFGDFTDDYRGSSEERQTVYEAHRKHWGRDWLMLPNPAYGSWEAAAFGGDYTLSEEEKRRRKIDALIGWAPDE